METIKKIQSNPESSARKTQVGGIVALICSASGALVMAFLIPFLLMQSCSPANIAIFLGLLGLSAVSGIAGAIMGSVSYRKTKNRLALFSLFFTLIYIALLIYLIQLLYG